VTVETTIRPRGPYSLALSARRASDSTRRFGNGVLKCVLGSGEPTAACQLPDGTLVLRAETEAGIEGLRFVLGNPNLRAQAGCTGTSNFFFSLGFSIYLVFAVLVALALALAHTTDGRGSCQERAHATFLITPTTRPSTCTCPPRRSFIAGAVPL
jgi:hypothetical protein